MITFPAPATSNPACRGPLPADSRTPRRGARQRLAFAVSHAKVHTLYILDCELLMRITKAFKNGHSQAVRIPAELAFERMDVELEIERCGDELRIRPARRSLAGVLTKFAQFSPDFMANGRGEQEQDDRDRL